MRGPRLHQLCLASLSLLGALLLLIQSAAAEGSPEFDTGDAVTSGDAHDQEVNSATVLYVDVLNPSGATEKICWIGSGSVTVYLPNGTSLATLTSSNMNGCTSALSTTGSYRIALGSSQTAGTRWELRVCASTVSNSDCRNTGMSNHRNGRLWSTEWSFQSNTNYDADRSNNGSVFAVVPGGDVGRDAVIEMQMRGVSGAFYRLFANSTGPVTSPGNVRVGRSVPKANHAVVPLYRLYLNPPGSALYNWIPPVVSSVVQTSTCSGSVVLDTAPGTVTFNSNVTGQYVLICDVSGDGQYDLSSDNDFSSFGNAAMNGNTVTWNGKTNAGANAAAGTYNCVVRLNVGEFHYMADDIESSHPGIRMFRVESDKTTKTAIRMFWDDTDLPADTETMNGVMNVFSPSFPVPAGLDPGTYATASAPFYFVGGNTSMPTGNARAWGNFDGDGKGNDNYLDTFAAADTMQSPAFQVSVVTAAGDPDNDGLGSAAECALGTDPEDIDTDNDGVNDGADTQPLVPSVCSDSDMDGCDDCVMGMGSNPANDGPDVDANGQCDNGDRDGDTVPNLGDNAPTNPLRCRDVDADGCDDCSAGAGPNLGNDGLDKDADVLCDKGDVDSDNDGISDTVELGGTDLSLDADNDTVADYRDPSYVACIDLLPINGICDSLPAAVDSDGDQVPNHLDRDSDRDGITDAREAGGTDANGDGVPDSCLPVTATGACGSGLITSPPNTDSPSDAIADYLDTDSDGDGLSDYIEAFDSNSDGTADVARSTNDTDQDGIDNSFDTNCIPASNCGGTLGQPITSPLSAARDSNGDGVADWLQVCGDAYVTSGQACDDGNSVNTDACSNSCLRGTSVGCLLNNQCNSMLCDLGTLSCQACTNNTSGGTDSGCTAGAPTCRTSAGVNSCVTCADTAAGTLTDDGCSAGSPMCNTAANGGLGACVACLADANCNDSNACTGDTCSSGACVFAPRTAGTSCTGGVCNGTAPAMCVTCVDNAATGATDSGCGGSTRACKTTGAGAPVCVACVADGDCASGVCGANNTCVTCEDNQAGATADHGCSGANALCNPLANAGAGACVACFDNQAGDTTDVGCGGSTPVCNGATNTCATCLDAVGNDDIGCTGSTAMCNTSGNGGLGACAACLNATHCSDGNSCTTDACTAGACSNPAASAGTSCTGGVCNGTLPAMCIACVDNAGVGQTDSGCGGSTRACKTSGAGAPVCVACVADGDCASGVCGANNTCVTCEDNQTGATADHGCSGANALCNAAANAGAGACVACFDNQAGDATDVGCGGATPVCNGTTNTCATCLDAAGNDDVGCSGATAMCNTAGNGGLGACAACLNATHCGDSNSCTTDACNAGVCSNPAATAGTSCTGGVCNGTLPAMCIACVDNAGVGQTDAGCSGSTKACKTTGAGAPVCVACVADGDCASGVCGANNTCVTCEDNQAGATTDHGCGGATALCNAAANSGAGACVACLDSQVGDTTDLGCGGATPVCNPASSTCATCLDAAGNDDIGCSGATAMCNTGANGGLGACAGCLADANCSDGNGCTTDTCASGMCSNPPASAGLACTGGVCNGTAPAMCVACVDNAAVGQTDAGCSGSTKACKTAGGAPVCVACVVDGDCASGVCGANNTCVTCEDNQAGAAADHGCSGATALCNANANGGAGACVGCFDSQAGDATDLGCGGATPVCNPTSSTCAACLDAAGDDDIGCSGASAMCNTSGNGGLGACAGCLNDGQCNDSNACTTDTCQSGSCDYDSLAAGSACAGGVCDGAASAPECITCLDDAASDSTDSGCDGDLPLCDESGVSPECVECLVLADCPMGMYCSSVERECVVGCAQDSDCVSFPETPRCEPTDQVCVECLTGADCQGTELCDANNACSQPDSDGDGVPDDVDLDDDNDGVTDDLELDGEDLSLDSDDDGVPDFRDVDAVTCTDAAPTDGVCDETAEEVDADGDGIANHLDLDSDGDGITDAREAADSDDDGDGIPDDCLPVDADGLCQSGSQEPASTDDDGTPDFLDLDSDGDGLLDLDEAFDSDGDGVSNIEPAGVDTDENGIDDAFDPSCADVGACNGVIGEPVLGALAPSQDWDGNGVPNWLQTCGDSYPTDGEACDDGNGVDGDACSNSCLRGLGEGCDDDAECGSMLCDPELETCQGCVDDETSGADAGCAVDAPTCVVVSGENTCVVCADDQTGLGADDGCSGDAALCDETAAGGLGACIECFSATDCDDDTECTTDSCSAGVCGNTAAAVGTACAGGVCDDQAVCVECVEDSDCGEGGSCNDGVCATGCATDDDCAGEEGATRCDTESEECVECTSDAHCRGEMLCTAGNTCSFDDNDGDGLSDDVDVDDDNDGITDSDELGGDLSTDEDGDGVLEYRELATLPEALDVDGDGIANHLDTDSDADGLPDATEGHDADFDGAPDRTPANADSDRDGLDDAFDADCSTASACDGVIGVVAPRPDADDDDKPNFLDADDDGDGRDTADERADADDYEGPADEPADIDGDGPRNWYDTDSDGDGALDITENMNGGDANDDDLLDYLDPSFRATDTDGDGVLDVVECPAPAHPDNADCPDTDGDGKPDYNDTDDDGDGVLTAAELNPPAGRDVDDDGKPNYLDTDDDDDGVLTRDELGEDGDVLDTDNDGTSNQLDTDDDNDGIPTERELDEDGAVMDTDDDGRPNHLDTDDDDDTIPTHDEIADDGSFLDTDDDDIPNHLDPDDDDDDILTADEPGDENDNDVPDYLEPYVAPTGGTLAGGALCAVSNTGSGSGSSLATSLLLGFGLLLTLRMRSRKKKPCELALLFTLFALFACLFVSGASAQVAVDQFKPAPLASDGFALSRPDVLEPGAWGLVLMLDYANDPLVFELIPNDEDSEHRVIADHLVGHVGAAVGIFDRLTIFGMLPIHLVMSGEDSPLVTAPEPDGAGIGDLAFGGRLLMLGTGTSTGALALEFIARVPTAALANGDQAYSGDSIGSYEPALVGELRGGRFDIRLRAGARLREPRNVGNLKLDHELVYGVGARYRVIEALYAHAEVYGSTFLQNAFAREQTPLEALLGGKYQPGDFNFGVAAGPGILRGYGSPDVRIVASIGYAPVEKHQEPVDTDGDGLFDPSDACPRDPEDKDQFEDQDGCPDPDNDKDGILDVQDECVSDPEDADEFEDENGCPDPDNDKDGIVDAQDKCMNDPEDTDDFEDDDGCPDPDNDKDGLLDGDDSCPNEPEDLDGFEDSDGCPEEGSGKVKVTCDKIDLQDMVFFDTGKDSIQERSYELLDQVVAVLKAAKHIKRMRIEGHTDDRGNDAKNLDLSKRRAASVVRYLVEHGIAEERLESEGYGESKPIDSNKTRAGRTANRRVEFVIVEQDSSCAK